MIPVTPGRRSGPLQTDRDPTLSRGDVSGGQIASLRQEMNFSSSRLLI